MDRITRVRIANVRSIEDATFDLGSVTVLVGENGSGKSTVIEVLSFLAQAPHQDLFALFNATCGGVASWARDPTGSITLEVRIEGDGAPIDYVLRIDPDGTRESVPVDSNRRIVAAFEGIEVHVARRDIQGGDLATAWRALENEHGDEHWAFTLDLVRIGLGDHVESVVPSAASDGSPSMSLKLKGREAPIPTRGLSDGHLAWLAFVALLRKPVDGGLLVIDGPELHLHPGLVARAIDLLETHSSTRSVLLATHSDRLLDCLRDPAGSVVVCALDGDQRTVVRRLDKAALDDWMRDYAGYGAIRDAGNAESVLSRNET